MRAYWGCLGEVFIDLWKNFGHEILKEEDEKWVHLINNKLVGPQYYLNALITRASQGGSLRKAINPLQWKGNNKSFVKRIIFKVTCWNNAVVGKD